MKPLSAPPAMRLTSTSSKARIRVPVCRSPCAVAAPDSPLISAPDPLTRARSAALGSPTAPARTHARTHPRAPQQQTVCSGVVTGVNYTIVTAFVGGAANPQNVISYVKAGLVVLLCCGLLCVLVLLCRCCGGGGVRSCRFTVASSIRACSKPVSSPPPMCSITAIEQFEQAELIREDWTWFDMGRPTATQQFMLRTRVHFVSQPQQGARGVKPPMPPVFPSLPEDIFYPFLVDSAAADRLRGGFGGFGRAAAAAVSAAAALAVLAAL